MKYEILRQGWGEKSVIAQFAHDTDAERFLEDYKWRYQSECYVFMREI